jgi:hypothetical protein
MAQRTRSKKAKKRQSRRKTRRGGGWSVQPSAFVSAGNPIRAPYPLGPDCAGNPESVRPGHLSAATASSFSGLPGMKGGNRVRFSMPGVPSQAGGRYEMSLGQSVLSPSMIATPAMASRIPCERGTENSLNLRGGSRMEVGQVDSMRLESPNAGYGNQFQVLPNGVPVTLQTPYAAGSLNRACLTTGGARRSKRGSKRSSKRSSKRGSKRSGHKRRSHHRQ